MGAAGARDEANRWTPEPVSDACRLRQACGVGVVGNLGAAVGVKGSVRLAGGDDLNAARAQQRAEADAESQSEGLFNLVAKTATGVVAAVRGIENYNEAGWRGCGGRLG